MRICDCNPSEPPTEHFSVQPVQDVRERVYDLASIIAPPTPDVVHQGKVFQALLAVHKSVYDHTPGRHFMTFLIMRFALSILRNHRGMTSSVMENNEQGKDHLPSLLGVTFGDIVIHRAECFLRDQIPKELHRRHCKCAVFMLHEIRGACTELVDLYRSLKDPNYAQAQCETRLATFKEELIARTCHPARIAWWMSHDDIRDIFGGRFV